VTRLRAGRPRLDSRQGHRTRPLWGPRTLLCIAYRGYSGRGVKLTTHFHLVSRLRMRRATPPFPHTS